MVTHMLGWIGRWWRKRQRRLDLEFLWPSIKTEAYLRPESREQPSLYLAREAFFLHCINDPCWTKDFDLVEIERIVGRLS